MSILDLMPIGVVFVIIGSVVLSFGRKEGSVLSSFSNSLLFVIYDVKMTEKYKPLHLKCARILLPLGYFLVFGPIALDIVFE